MLASLRPRLHDGVFVYVTLADASQSQVVAASIASVREPEGLSLVLPIDAATRFGLVATFRCRWITLEVQSSLSAIGLTAAVAKALTEHGLSCNMIAGFHHDHLLVPEADATAALAVLKELAAATLPAGEPAAPC